MELCRGFGSQTRLFPHPIETTTFPSFHSCGREDKTYSHPADIASFSVIDRMVQQDVMSRESETIKDNYLSPASLKKVDIGGGLIHGLAKDLQSDRSQKVTWLINRKASASKKSKLAPRHHLEVWMSWCLAKPNIPWEE